MSDIALAIFAVGFPIAVDMSMYLGAKRRAIYGQPAPSDSSLALGVLIDLVFYIFMIQYFIK